MNNPQKPRLLTLVAILLALGMGCIAILQSGGCKPKTSDSMLPASKSGRIDLAPEQTNTATGSANTSTSTSSTPTNAQEEPAQPSKNKKSSKGNKGSKGSKILPASKFAPIKLLPASKSGGFDLTGDDSGIGELQGVDMGTKTKKPQTP